MTSTTLRAVAHRLTTTPVEQLPSIAAFLATALSDCAELLSTSQTQKSGKPDSENAVQIHKIKTRLASLLQDRSVEGRWTAVVLAKALVEAGQWEVLRGYEPIVRSLIGILAVSQIILGVKFLWLMACLEIRPCIHEKNVHYYSNTHFPSHVSIPYVGARDHYTTPPGVHHSSAELGLNVG